MMSCFQCLFQQELWHFSWRLAKQPCIMKANGLYASGEVILFRYFAKHQAQLIALDVNLFQAWPSHAHQCSQEESHAHRRSQDQRSQEESAAQTTQESEEQGGQSEKYGLPVKKTLFSNTNTSFSYQKQSLPIKTHINNRNPKFSGITACLQQRVIQWKAIQPQIRSLLAVLPNHDLQQW